MPDAQRWIHASGPLPVDEAWERYADPDRWSSWAPHLRAVEIEASGVDRRLHPGLTGVVLGPVGVRAHFVVKAVDEAARRWSWEVRALGVTLQLLHTLDASPEDTHAGLVLQGPLPVVLLYRPVARWALRRLVAVSAHPRRG